MANEKEKSPLKELNADVVKARSFILVDENGAERAHLECSAGEGKDDGYTVVHINDAQGRPRITLQVDNQGNPSISLFTENNAQGISMGVFSDRGNGLTISGNDGKNCIMVGVPDPGQSPGPQHPHIHIIDESNHRSWSAFEGTHDLKEK